MGSLSPSVPQQMRNYAYNYTDNVSVEKQKDSEYRYESYSSSSQKMVIDSGVVQGN